MDLNSETKTLVGHLGDLRTVLLRSSLAIGIGVILSFIVIPYFFKILILPYSSALALDASSTSIIQVQLQSLNPSDTFMMSMRLALIGGIIISSPYIFKLLWGFIAPGILPTEKKFVLPVFIAGLLFFTFGALFAYFIMLPNALHFFRSYSLGLGIKPVWTISHYISFVTTIILVFGISFELPVVIVLLSWAGVLTPASLAAYRKYVIVGIVVAAAFLTPPDVISLVLLTLPLIALFELSVLASRVICKMKLGKKSESED